MEFSRVHIPLARMLSKQLEDMPDFLLIRVSPPYNDETRILLARNFNSGSYIRLSDTDFEVSPKTLDFLQEHHIPYIELPYE